ncbi:MAG: UDP-N-acetylmuramoyl-L-alanyl-D-glutamate--2,6-diaminopimelate ligase [Oligoflexia bacterium]|nr:UDP-N-acetylmuramoyl-L-alanyl-D-glutamate--2,6-diaminopimelate ligase [Oligoflexia bacterium]
MKITDLLAAKSFRGVTSDSREVAAGTVFVAVRGTARDGHLFIGEAVKKGAVAIVGHRDFRPSPADLGSVPYIGVEDERLVLAQIAAAFHGHPSRTMQVIGVTGTSGKTTTTYLIESILRAAGHRVGLIGTVEFRSGQKRYPSTHTTPGPVELQRLLAEMKADGCDAVVMEVSSHALKQHRTAGIVFAGVVFTNLSPEHLDFHPDMDDYFDTKASLFLAYPDWRAAAINGDDRYGQKLLQELRARASAHPRRQIVSFGMGKAAEVSGANLKIDLEGIHGKAGGLKIDSSLIGEFNAMNLLAAASVCRELGVPAQVIEQGIKEAHAPPGRLESVQNSQGIHVLVDYAHKPDALEKILAVLSEIKGSHRLITVFGCGGDRDRSKRPVMGGIAAQKSDLVWVTSDNPRTENPEAILQEILTGISERGHVRVESDRKKAIFAAIAEARSGDLVLIAGKGHEDYQILPDPSSPSGVKKIHFDDRETAAAALRLKH